MNLTPAERAILRDILINGDNTPKNIAEDIDFSREHVSDLLTSLEDENLVENKGGGVYRLTNVGIAVARNVMD